MHVSRAKMYLQKENACYNSFINDFIKVESAVWEKQKRKRQQNQR